MEKIEGRGSVSSSSFISPVPIEVFLTDRRWPDIIVFTHDDVRRISIINESSYESRTLVKGLDLGNVGDVLYKKNSVFWADSKDKIFGTDLGSLQVCLS